MVRAMLLSLLLTLAQPADTTEQAPPPPDCSYDLEAMLELDLNAFDQDIPNGGWRRLSNLDCHEEAAELIRAWRHEKRNHRHILYWHEGQMRAFAGQTDEAIALFDLTRKSQDFDADFGWNHYVDGTIAFLRRDKDGLDRAIERLSRVPEPENTTITLSNGIVIEQTWPPNMNVLRAFENCWIKSYSAAYGSEECSEPVYINED